MGCGFSHSAGSRLSRIERGVANGRRRLGHQAVKQEIIIGTEVKWFVAMQGQDREQRALMHHRDAVVGP